MASSAVATASHVAPPASAAQLGSPAAIAFDSIGIIADLEQVMARIRPVEFGAAVAAARRASQMPKATGSPPVAGATTAANPASVVDNFPAACTTVMYEGTPDFPDKDRFWRIIEKHGITICYTAPTAIRTFMKWGDQHPARHDLSRLRLLGSVGEPINPEAWMWYHKVIGKERCPIVDTWWQTETGAIVISPLPGVTATEPGSATAVPIFHRANVYTAYEYLEQRFDAKTRLAGSLIFLAQRGLSAGLTIYAPALVLSVIITGLILVICTWFLLIGWGTDRVDSIATAANLPVEKTA